MSYAPGRCRHPQPGTAALPRAERMASFRSFLVARASSPNATRICSWALFWRSWFFFCEGLFWWGFVRDRPAGGLAPFDKAAVLFFCRWPERVRELGPWPRERIGTAAFPCG